VLLYSALALAISMILMPILFLKSLLNAGYIVFHTKRQAYKGEKIVAFALNFVASPFVIGFSMMVDLLSLGNFLMRKEKGFQFKYRQFEDNFGDIDPEKSMMNFGRIFYGEFDQKYRNKRVNFQDLMRVHTKAYDLVENLHDLFCRGSKNYKEALTNVQTYNMTKVLSRRSSIPNDSGDVKQSICDFNVIHAVQMDIEMYNFVHQVFKDFYSGKLEEERRLQASRSLSNA
jgi:hypothetical protein